MSDSDAITQVLGLVKNELERALERLRQFEAYGCPDVAALLKERAAADEVASRVDELAQQLDNAATLNRELLAEGEEWRRRAEVAEGRANELFDELETAKQALALRQGDYERVVAAARRVLDQVGASSHSSMVALGALAEASAKEGR